MLAKKTTGANATPLGDKDAVARFDKKVEDFLNEVNKDEAGAEAPKAKVLVDKQILKEGYDISALGEDTKETIRANYREIVKMRSGVSKSNGKIRDCNKAIDGLKNGRDQKKCELDEINNAKGTPDAESVKKLTGELETLVGKLKDKEEQIKAHQEKINAFKLKEQHLWNGIDRFYEEGTPKKDSMDLS